MKIETLFFVLVISASAYSGQYSDLRMPSGGHASLRAYPEAKISVKDSRSRVTIYVEGDGRHIVGISESGDLLWRTEIISNSYSCVAGLPVVRDLTLSDGKVIVTFCKHSYGEINISTGEYRFLGQD